MDEISDHDLQWASWWIEHQAQVKKGILIAIIAMLSLLILYSSWQVVGWLASYKAEKEMYNVLTSQQVNFDGWWQKNKPNMPQLGKVYSIPSKPGFYDLIVSVKNPNLRWVVESFNYTFEVDGEVYTGQSFLLPMDDKYLLSLAVPATRQPQSATVDISDLNWRRLRDLNEYTAPNFTVEDQDLQQVTIPGKDWPANKLNFKLANQSPYGYRGVVVTAILLYGGSIQAIGQQTVSEISSAEILPVSFYWPEAKGMIDNLIVKAEVNVLNPEAIKPLE